MFCVTWRPQWDHCRSTHPTCWSSSHADICEWAAIHLRSYRLIPQTVLDLLDPLDFSKASLWGSLVAERHSTWALLTETHQSLFCLAYSRLTRQNSRGRGKTDGGRLWKSPKESRERQTSVETERCSVLTRRRAARARETDMTLERQRCPGIKKKKKRNQGQRQRGDGSKSQIWIAATSRSLLFNWWLSFM